MTLLPLPLLAFILILGLAMGFVLDEFWSWLNAGVAEWHSIRPGRRIPATVGRMQGSSPCRQHSANTLESGGAAFPLAEMGLESGESRMNPSSRDGFRPALHSNSLNLRALLAVSPRLLI